MTAKAPTQAATLRKPIKRRGRRSLMTIEKIDEICQFIRAGNYQKTAAAICGIKERTWYNWIEKARARKRPNKKQLHLLQSISQAEAEFEGFHVQKIFNSKDPRISLEMLARRFPDRWAAISKSETRQVDKAGKDVKLPGVLVVPGQMDEDKWTEAAARYKELQPKVEEPADGGSDSVH